MEALRKVLGTDMADPAVWLARLSLARGVRRNLDALAATSRSLCARSEIARQARMVLNLQ
jgi:hypothetical protein